MVQPRLSDKKAHHQPLGGSGVLCDKTPSFEGVLGYLNLTTLPPILNKQLMELSSTHEQELTRVNNVLEVPTVTVLDKAINHPVYGKYKVLRMVNTVLSGMGLRVENCMKEGAVGVPLVKAGDGIVRPHGVWMCESPWICPVCSRRLAERLRQQLIRGVEASRLNPVMATFTVSHGVEDTLTEVLDLVKDSSRGMKQGSGFAKLKDFYGIKYYATNTEIRTSALAGSHAHQHVLFLTEEFIEDLDGFREALNVLFIPQVEKHGGYASQYHGIAVTQGKADLASYLVKWGYAGELLNSGSKKGKREDSYTFYDLIVLASEGNKWAEAKAREYALSTHRRKTITWSKGMKEALRITDQIDESVKVEEEQEKPPDEIVIILHRKTWKAVRYAGLIGEVLYLAGAGGRDAVLSFLEERHLPIDTVSPPSETSPPS